VVEYPDTASRGPFETDHQAVVKDAALLLDEGIAE